MRSNALRYGCLANSWHPDHRRESILQNTANNFLHFSLSAYKIGHFSSIERIDEFLLDKLVIALSEGSKNAAHVFLLFRAKIERFCDEIETATISLLRVFALVDLVSVKKENYLVSFLLNLVIWMIS